jgi:sugar phosphate isomerase/epimerase
MKAIMFSKHLLGKNLQEMIELAQGWGLDGYDLAVRPGYPVNPDNAATALPEAVKMFRDAGLDIPMVTGNFDLLSPDHPTARPLLSAMDAADVRLLKLGYFHFNPEEGDYWAEVVRIRDIFTQWELASREFGVRICYHTHSVRCMGLNASALMHLLRGFNPAHLGAYIDAGHLVAEGEEFAVAAAIVQEFLAIVAVKDFLLEREEVNGHGSAKRSVVEAGKGMVNWTQVFETLNRIGYDGPVSIHCEFGVEPDEFLPAAGREIAFFRQYIPKEG